MAKRKPRKRNSDIIPAPVSEDRINFATAKPRRAFQEYALWREAVECADNGDSSRLIKLLQTGPPPGPESRRLIADLLARRPLGRKRGRQATPAYQLTAADARLAHLHALVRFFQCKKHDLKSAMQAALREEKRDNFLLKDDRADDQPDYTDEQLDEMISPADQQALANFIGGRRTSSRRMSKRRQAD